MSAAEGDDAAMALLGCVGPEKGLGFDGNCQEAFDGCNEEHPFSRWALLETPLVFVERTDRGRRKKRK